MLLHCPGAVRLFVCGSLLFSSLLPAQRVTIGVVAGAPVTRDFNSSRRELFGFQPLLYETGRGGPVVGPSVQVRLFPHLLLEVSGLYNQLHYRQAVTFANGNPVSYAPAAVVTWEFPVLARYEFSTGRVRPFLEGGPSFRTAGNLNNANPSHFGLTAGAGVAVPWGRFTLSPRLRYTRWAQDDRRFDLRTRADQVQLLMGLHYGSSLPASPLGRRVSFGVVVGAPLTDEQRSYVYSTFGIRVVPGPPPAVINIPATGQFQAHSHQFGAGPLIEVGLTDRTSLELNAIPRAFRGRFTLREGEGLNGRVLNADETTVGATWEFPVLAKYRLRTGRWQPFLAAGPSFRLPKEVNGAWLGNYGVTGGVGVETRLWRLRIAPAVRYTHWGPARARTTGTAVNNGIYRNQVQGLVGISF